MIAVYQVKSKVHQDVTQNQGTFQADGLLFSHVLQSNKF